MEQNTKTTPPEKTVVEKLTVEMWYDEASIRNKVPYSLMVSKPTSCVQNLTPQK